MWTFNEAEAYLNDTAPPGKSKYGLGRINHLLDLLDHPEYHFPCVTIVGTNGKGSTLAFLDSLIRAHGLIVACHIKPHLESVTERIRIDGLDSTPAGFASALWEVKESVNSGWTRDDKPTYFELIFAAALCASRSAHADIALLETGLGGRLDAVNSVDASMVILASVDYDHTELLGNSLESITREKIAVVRPGTTLICQVNPPVVMETVRSHTSENEIHLIDADDRVKIKQSSDGIFSYHSPALGLLENLALGLDGPYQPMNAGLSLLALETLSTNILPDMFMEGIQEEACRDGLINARLPGRWERIHPDDDLLSGHKWILDGAHNVAGLQNVLSQFVKETSGRGTVIFGMKKAKPVEEIIPVLLKSSANLVFVKVPDLESHDPEELAQIAERRLDNKGEFSQIHISCTDSIIEGMSLAMGLTPRSGSILVTGSLYLAGAVRSVLRGSESILKA